MVNIWAMLENTSSGANSFPTSILLYAERYNPIHGYTCYYNAQSHTYINSALIDTTKLFKKSADF